MIYFKRQGDLDGDYRELLENDFLLVIMNDGQLEALKKYGSDCLCIDGTHGLNAYNFQLTTLMVLDDLRQGFPCMFAFSNRSDTYVMTVIFNVIKKLLCKEISPKIFMSDMDETFYKAWCEVMGAVDVRLFCVWHVIKAWKKNLNTKIRDTEKQKSTYKILRMLLEEPDKVTFEKILPACLKDLYADPELHNFANYFKEYCRKQEILGLLL
ncbi:hypothetical protein NQ314_016231 [Rhamnusium bicolor]|uniref:MULE transposase domain-containing protein n=1 Tax=Rhamnusium bicolor TaxID=1586634 RepID=A0AAV8WWR3_9CUCU|nr:hypothetical protein NQ314_016231 [Rhamnusium bicolor]